MVVCHFHCMIEPEYEHACSTTEPNSDVVQISIFERLTDT
jgi:hypothetical protein